MGLGPLQLPDDGPAHPTRHLEVDVCQTCGNHMVHHTFCSASAAPEGVPDMRLQRQQVLEPLAPPGCLKEERGEYLQCIQGTSACKAMPSAPAALSPRIIPRTLGEESRQGCKGQFPLASSSLLPSRLSGHHCTHQLLPSLCKVETATKGGKWGQSRDGVLM